MMRHLKSYRLFESDSHDLPAWVEGKPFENPKSKRFLYHGTDIDPRKFEISDEYEEYDMDLPMGAFFLTTNIKEAAAYGQYVIPCELRGYRTLVFDLKAFAPSRV